MLCRVRPKFDAKGGPMLSFASSHCPGDTPVERPQSPAPILRKSISRHPMRNLAMILGLRLAALAGCQLQNKAGSPVAEVPTGSFMRKWAASVALKNDSVANIYVREDLLIVYSKNHFG